MWAQWSGHDLSAIADANGARLEQWLVIEDVVISTVLAPPVGGVAANSLKFRVALVAPAGRMGPVTPWSDGGPFPNREHQPKRAK